MIAHTQFNDTFLLRNSSGYMSLRKKGIAWPADVAYKFKNPPPTAPGIRVIPDFEDEDFIVWMRTAGLPSFSKLYRIVDYDLVGNFTVDIYNSAFSPTLLLLLYPFCCYCSLLLTYFLFSSDFPVKSFNGEKYVVISEISWMGGKNAFLGIAYMSVGSVCLAFSIVFLIKHKFAGRKLGEISYLGWNRG